MSSSDDSSDCECSDFGLNGAFYYDSFPPPEEVTSKKYRLVESVVYNDIDTLRELLNKPSKWYQVTDKDGNNLLQIAVLKNRKIAFDYVLSLDEFPLGHCNKKGFTALALSLLPSTRCEYFALELIKKGIYVHKFALHDAVRVSYREVIKVLFEKEITPNLKSPDGVTALHICLKERHFCAYTPEPYRYETEFMLLYYGADPFLEDVYGYSSFEEALRPNFEHLQFLGFLFNYTVDKFTKLKLNMLLLLELADRKSFFFSNVISHLSEVTVNAEGAQNYNKLLSVDRKYLNVLVEKCGFLIIYVLIANKYIRELVPFTVSVNISIENFSSFVENSLKQDFVDFVSGLESNKIFGTLIHLDLKESTITELICYLLSYGLNLNELDLQMIYKKYGYCQLFKILLHTDFQFVPQTYVKLQDVSCIEKSIVPIIIYDINFDLHTYLESLNIPPKKYRDTKEKYTLRHIDLLLDYFVDQKLKEVCTVLNKNEDLLKTRLTHYKNSKVVVAAKIEKLPQIPSLLQLARDTFRKFVIDKCEIKTTAQFYTYMNSLPINDTYKKIITFEKKLY